MGGMLVHVCCAPDAVYFLKKLKEDFPTEKLVAFFYDPNIHPYEEYRLRLVETKRVCGELGIPLIEGEYDPENWLLSVRGYENEPERGERCTICFDIRLERSAKLAGELGLDSMTTTLLMSPKKSFQQLRQSGERVAQKHGIRFVAVDYRKGGGTQEMFRLSREKEIYKQDYCGCIYGLFQQKEGSAIWDLTCFKGRLPGSREETLFVKELREFCEARSIPVKEFEFPILGWRVLEGGVWAGDEPIPSFPLPYSRSIRGRVKATPTENGKGEIVFSKQFVRLIPREPFRDEPLESFSGINPPSFLVPASYREKILSSKVTVSLRTEFLPLTSRVLLIGNLEADEIVGIPADTLQDGRGWTFSSVSQVIDNFSEELRGGRKALAVVGSYSLCGAGKKFLEEELGLKVRMEPYPS
jgi:predicted adenine nucleotide alpha hydrolase (AANH) superfamily ATPase